MGRWSSSRTGIAVIPNAEDVLASDLWTRALLDVHEILGHHISDGGCHGSAVCKPRTMRASRNHATRQFVGRSRYGCGPAIASAMENQMSFEVGPKRTRRVCILSGGGDAPGLNAVIRAFVHAASHLDIAVFGSRYGFEGSAEPELGIVLLSIDTVRGILPRGGSVLGCSTRINPFKRALKHASTPSDLGPEIARRLRSMDIDALVLIGGDGTVIAAKRFMQLGCLASRYRRRSITTSAGPSNPVVSTVPLRRRRTQSMRFTQRPRLTSAS